MGIFSLLLDLFLYFRLCSTARSTISISGQGRSPELFYARFDMLQVLRRQGLFDHFWWQ